MSQLSKKILSEELIEILANLEHERWAHWQKYMHSKCVRQQDGSLLIPADLVSRWERQIATPYNQLTEQEQLSDRDQVKPIIQVLSDALNSYEKNIDSDK